MNLEVDDARNGLLVVMKLESERSTDPADDGRFEGEYQDWCQLRYSQTIRAMNTARTAAMARPNRAPRPTR